MQRPVLAGADPVRRCSSLGLGCLIVRELRIANPVVNFRPLGERNLAACCVIIFCAYRRALRCQHVLAGLAPVPVRLRRLRLGTGAVARGIVLRHDAVRRRHAPRSGRGRPLADRRGPADHGGRQLLDGADEPVHQPGPGDLAEGGDDRRPLDDLRPAQRRRLQIHSRCICAGAAVGLLALLRNEGGSVGTSMAQTMAGASRTSSTRPRRTSSSTP